MKEKKYTKKQLEQINAKFDPQKDKLYLVTDQCFWETNRPEHYNIFDPNRKPHTLQLVEVSTGTIVNLPSGSLVQIVKLPHQDK